MLYYWRVGSRVAYQKPHVAVAALVQDPIAHHELIALGLFGSCLWIVAIFFGRLVVESREISLPRKILRFINEA
ncbi:hypothetical protein CP49_41800 [Bradyrhizobium valentinum]|uniref:Uncharacterized protein n=1 Tax=Bradyrhizobium valentinum TaxID=1518501 RepID=A0A0R3KTQ2_9BRAD|nr:hypothetical protein CP49_41800 [Bradyrhizobium valentinum]